MITLTRIYNEERMLDPIKVLRADIDYNKHMNNANYVRVAMELLPEDFTVRGLRVEYRASTELVRYYEKVINVFIGYTGLNNGLWPAEF